VVPLARTSVARLQRAIRQVLDQPSYRERVAVLQRSIRNAGAVGQAIDIVEECVATGEPVVSIAPLRPASAH